jgi:hypothetical protein
VENIWASTKTQPFLFRENMVTLDVLKSRFAILLHFHVSAFEFAGDECFKAKLDSIRFDHYMANLTSETTAINQCFTKQINIWPFMISTILNCLVFYHGIL